MAMTDWLKYLPGAASIGAGAYGLFGNQQNPADKANQYIGQIPDKTKEYYQPWMQAGQNQLPGLEQQYGDLLNNPGGKVNEIGSSFHESPGFKFALQQALQGANHAAAAGGMAGTPQHEQQNMQVANDIGNQDYYKYLDHAQQMYGAGLQGSQGLAGMGQQGGSDLASMIASALAQQGSNAAIGAMQKNQNQNSGIGNILGGLSSFLF